MTFSQDPLDDEDICLPSNDPTDIGLDVSSLRLTCRRASAALASIAIETHLQ